MRLYLVILKDTQQVPDFQHPTEIMGQSPQQVRQLLSEDTPAEYIQGVYTPQEYLNIVSSSKFLNLFASFNPGMPQPALKNVVGTIIEIAKGYVAEDQMNNQSQIDMAKLAGVTGGGDLSPEENFDIDTQTAPAPQYVINPHPSNIRDGDITTNPFGNAPKNPQQLKKTEVKYFTESGIKFKLENGQLYKKEWTDTPIEPYMDKVTDPKTGEEKEVEIIPDFRLISKDTRKPVKNSKVILQQAIWKKLES